MALEPIFKPFTARPKTKIRPRTQLHALIRDQFTLTTWLLLGALIQGLATLFLPYRNIVLVLPALLLLGFKATHTLLQVLHIAPNPKMATVIPHRTAIAYPSKTGAPEPPGHRPICMILLSVVSHHPLGMLAPGFKEVGDRFDAMLRELNSAATSHGFLGASAWVNAERATSNEVARILYFEDEEAMWAYAHGEKHTATMQWWAQATRGKPYLGIMHEAFAAPRGGWEGVYLNYHPTGLAATVMQVEGEEGKKWVSPLVRAKGKLLYSKGRMGREFGEKEWVEFEEVRRGEGEEGGY